MQTWKTPSRKQQANTSKSADEGDRSRYECSGALPGVRRYRIYKRSSRDLAAAVEGILQADRFLVQNEQEVFIAMIAVKTGSGSFSDALIGALGAWAGCSATITFDKRAKRLDGFEVL